MRAYVITDESTGVIGLTSSKKIAIDACEEFLDQVGSGQDITWTLKDKHVGHATCGGRIVGYKMFFVNRIEVD